MKLSPAFILAPFAAALAACAATPKPETDSTPAASVAMSAHVALAPASDSHADGMLTLVAQADGVRITGFIKGLESGGTHGFHVHEKGDCSAPDASSAGPHFNPHGAAHGHAGQGEHHAGDIPNLVADEGGRIAVDTVVPGLTLGDGGIADIAGRAIVLHAAADDYSSQPAGNSGARIACGVIE